MEYKGINVEWLGHASVLLQGSKRVYIDPFKLRAGAEPADLILITHGHYDHCSLPDIKLLLQPLTIIVGTVDIQSKVGQLGTVDFRLVHQGASMKLGNILLETFPAYNLNKQFHKKAEGWVGYMINLDGVRVAHAGDTDATPELMGLKGIDILFLPVGGTYTMNAEEAASVANRVMPKLAIPMHYGSIVGGKPDAERFRQLCKCPAAVL